ncbi:hypothetical protein [Streptomyces antimycoticus]|uniref:hypothetical protein n=1 Tax=Streptomyces antimycoticus TaxID=68175 RepID=UPI003863F027|nr:hypothetical protein OG751_04375 [Streptomyces antimycoticus]
MTKIVKHQQDRETSDCVGAVPPIGDMANHIQPALDGMPELDPKPARPQSEDYETWLDIVWPKYVEAAESGRVFTCFEIADAHQLPDPPNPQAHWGRLMTLLKDEGYVRTAGWACTNRPTAHHSGVRTWKGTRAAQQGRAA